MDKVEKKKTTGGRKKLPKGELKVQKYYMVKNKNAGKVKKALSEILKEMDV